MKKIYDMEFRSSTEPGSVPLRENLAVGQIALNLADDLIYSVNTRTDRVVPINLPLAEALSLICKAACKKQLKQEGKGLVTSDYTDDMRLKLSRTEPKSEENWVGTKFRDRTTTTAIMLASGMYDHTQSGDHDLRYPTREETDAEFAKLRPALGFTDTNLGLLIRGDDLIIQSSTGENVSLPFATPYRAGLLTKDDWEKVHRAVKGAEPNLPAITCPSDSDKHVFKAIGMRMHIEGNHHDHRYHTKDEIDKLLILPEYDDQGNPIARIIRTPALMSITNGDTNVGRTIFIKANSYLNAFDIPRRYRRFQIDFEEGYFNSPVYDKWIDEDEHLAEIVLEPDTKYRVRVSDYAIDDVQSYWSNDLVFTTSSEDFLLSPEEITISNPDSSVLEQPTFSIPDFSLEGDLHSSTYWRVETRAGFPVWEHEGFGVERTAVTLPSGLLQLEQDYNVLASYKAKRLGYSIPELKEFSTADSFFNLRVGLDAGVASNGGIYSGGNIEVDGKTYAVIVAPNSQGGSSSVQLPWKETTSITQMTSSVNNGRLNTQAMLEDDKLHPAAQFCADLEINGFSDWHLPSRDELEIMYRYLKPTENVNYVNSWGKRPNGSGENSNVLFNGDSYTAYVPAITTASNFREGEIEAFNVDGTEFYWSSTQENSIYSWVQSFSDGAQDHDNNPSKTNLYWVRAVRWVEVAN